MLSSTIRKWIFQSLPKSVVVGSIEYQAWVDYADRINVAEKLKEYPIAVTLRYFADRRDNRNSPANRLLRKVADQDIRYTKGERAVITLSINVHAANSPAIPAADIVDAYMTQLLTWYLRDLAEIEGIEVAGRGEVRDLSYLEGGVRRQLDIFIRYRIEYEETIPTIETVEKTLQI